jgi:ABC-type antimicrobial peptide transport system permease subunit
VGVVPSVKQYGLDTESRMALYLPYKQVMIRSTYVLAHTTVDPATVSRSMIQAVHSVDPNLAPYDLATMDERVSHSVARQRFSMLMLSSLAGFALVLAGIGVYGVLSYVVGQGTRDIGLRMALGARRAVILRMVLRHGMGLVVVGIVVGTIGAEILGRIMQSLLFEVKPTDIPTFSIVALFLSFVALAASYLPARRAMSVDPVVALREE